MAKSRNRPTADKRQAATGPGRQGAPGGLPASARAAHLLAHVGVPVAFFVFVWLWHPFHKVFEFDPDEGNNVIKALMLAKGHFLYTEIWSDQPPLFTYLLRGWFALTDWTVAQARVLVLLCASVLLWAFYQTIRLSWGHATALASAFLLVISYRYIALSVSVMLALPTLMFAMLSLYTLARYRQGPHWGWLVGSGVLLALSLFTKLFTFMLAPLMILALLGIAWSRPAEPQQPRSRFQPVLWWVGGFVGTGVVLFLLTLPLGDLKQLLQPHLDARKEMTKGFEQVYTDMLRHDYEFAFLGLCGLLRIFRKRHWFSLLPVVWCLLAYVSLWRHRPLWYHHYAILAVPLCWTAGIGLGALFSGEVWRALWPWRWRNSSLALPGLVGAVVFGILVAMHVPSKFQRELDYANDYVEMTPRGLYTTAVLKQFKDRTEYVVTDLQMLAFSAGMIVPPELSVTSVKRMRSRHLSMETLLGLLQRYRPGVIHLSWRNRIPLTQELQDFLGPDYAWLYADPRGDRCYVRKDLAADPLLLLQRAADEVPQAWEGHYNLAVQLARLGRSEEAARAYERCLERCKESRAAAPAYGGLGEMLKRLGRRREAAEKYEAQARILDRLKKDSEAAQARSEAERLRAQAGP